ncbi:MAG: helix-turn-helix domain-containing protein [Syntrophobacteraceae bacterium]|nr:helix-turn-helix domain containing protein [Desulfobacteraceae bacterium]
MSRSPQERSISQHASRHDAVAAKSPDPYFSDKWDRLKLALNAGNDSQLARSLGIEQASVAVAKKRRQIPSKWLPEIFEKYHISADWILSGIGPMRRSEHMADDEQVREEQCILPDTRSVYENRTEGLVREAALELGVELPTNQLAALVALVMVGYDYRVKDLSKELIRTMIMQGAVKRAEPEE